MNVVVVGLGLLGGSFALALRKLDAAARISAVDRPSVLDRPAAQRAAQELIDAADVGAVNAAVETADFVLLATPVTTIVSLLPELVSRARIVTDCGSTKRVIARAVDGSPRRGRFVPGHPMAGAPEGGIDLARPELFRGRRWILCPEKSDADAVDVVAGLVTRLGAVVVRLSAAEHDRAVALTSHVTQLVASALAAVALESGAEPAVGPAFERTTQAAGGPEQIWDDILATNADAVAAALGEIAAELEQARAGLAQVPPDTRPAMQLLGRARRALRGAP
jgi:prephenate dehydrogenase